MGKTERRKIKWAQAKQELMKDFDRWIKECEHTRRDTPKDMIEFLYQKGYIRGKDWHKFIDSVAEGNRGSLFFIHYEPMLEGFIPPDTYV